MSAEPRFPPEFHPLTQETNKAVLERAHSFGCKVYLVGGYIRDALLGRLSLTSAKDFDYTVLDGSAVAFARDLEQNLHGHFVLLDESNDTARVVLDDGTQIDLAGCVGGSLVSDIQRRDLTINALVWDAAEPDRIRDDVGGIADLNTKTIRAISEQCLIDDPLRLMRAFRFAAALNFQIEEKTIQMVAKNATKLNSVAAERISYELFAIMETARAAETIKQMHSAGLLEVIFPEMSDMHRVPPNSYHHLGLFDHSLEVMRQTELGLREMPDWTRPSFEAHLSHSLTRYGATKLAALLHDVGKPATWVVAEDGRHTFIGHDKLGAEMCTELAKRLKWSKPVDRFVANLVRWHLRPGHLFHQGLPTPKALNKFFRTIDDDVPQLVLLALGDFRGTCGPGLQEGRELLENQLRELLELYVVFNNGAKQTPLLLDGTEIMHLLDIPQGPSIGMLLEELREAQDSSEITDKPQAEAFIKERYQQKYCK